MTRTHTFTWRGMAVGLICCLSSLGALTACGGGTASSSPVQAAAADTPAAEQAVLAAALPRPADITRDVAQASSGLRCDGSGFRADLLKQNASPDGFSVIFNPREYSASKDPIPSSALAIYDFDLSLLSDPTAPLEYVVRGTASSGGGAVHVYCGTTDHFRNAWVWHELEPSSSSGDGGALDSWSWGETQSGSGGKGTSEGGIPTGRRWYPAVILVQGDASLTVESVEVRPANDLPAGGTVVCRKGYDYYQAQSALNQAQAVATDGNGDTHFTSYDVASGQLYHTWLHNRTSTTQAVDCEGDAGLFHDLCPRPDGGLTLAYYDLTLKRGLIKTLAPDELPGGDWSPASVFDDGDDGRGGFADVGRRSSLVFDAEGSPHVFYEDTTNGRIKHAFKPLGALDWLSEFVSPERVLAGCPVALYYGGGGGGGGVVCVYSSENKLFLAEPGAAGWSSFHLADDVIDPLDPSSTTGRCDAIINDGWNMLQIAFSSSGGAVVAAFDISVFGFEPTPIASAACSVLPGSGALIDIAALGDGSVRVAHYSLSDKRVYFASAGPPTGDAWTFTSLPAVQLGGDEDCDGLCLDVAPDADGDGLYKTSFALLLSSANPSTDLKHYEFRGHVTVLK